MGASSEWRDKAAYYWRLSKAAMDYDLCEQYAELAACYLDLAEARERQAMNGHAGRGYRRRHSAVNAQ